MRLSIFALAAATTGCTVAHSQPVNSQSLLRNFVGEWRIALLQASRTAPYGTRRYSFAFRDSALLEWFDRSSTDSVLARGFLGRDPRTGLLFYVSVTPNAPPTSITGFVRTDSTIEWRILPEVDATHPFNRELVSSRLTIFTSDRMDWIGERARWHFIFERIP